METFVVTGGGGFIGSNLVAHLVENGHEVRVIDDFSTGRRENLDGLEDDITLHEGSITDENLLQRVLDGANYVLHQAAIPSVQRSVEEPVKANEVNVGGTLKVLEAARHSSVRRVVYASSSSIYGDQPTLPKTEGMRPDPRSPYAANKLAGEYYAGLYYDLFDLETV